MPSERAATAPIEVYALSTAWRLLIAALIVVGCGSLPVLLAAVWFSTDPPVEPPVLFRAFGVFSALPILAARLIRLAFAARVEREPDRIAVAGRGGRIEIPDESIRAVHAWTVPLPGVGVSIELRSGGRLAQGLMPADSRELPLLLDALDRGAPSRDPTALYASAKRAAGRRTRLGLGMRYGVYPLIAAVIFFRAHQFIAYGGTFGQYYLEGARPYLATFAEYWATIAIYLVLYAAVWRGLAEAVALFAAWIAPDRASGVRRLVEWVYSIAFYAGVPFFVALRFID